MGSHRLENLSTCPKTILMLTQSPNSEMLPEFSVDDFDLPLHNLEAPAPMATTNDQLVGDNDSLNGVEFDDLAAQPDAFFGELGPPMPAEPLIPEPQPEPEPQQAADADAHVDRVVSTPMEEAPEEPLPPAPAEGVPEAGPVAPKKSKAAPRKGVTGGKFANKVKHACTRCQ